MAVLKDGNVRLSNGLRVGSTKKAVEHAFGLSIPACDTIPFSTEKWTYDNYLVMRHDTVAEIYMAVTAD